MAESKTILFAGGGTGGHLYPGIAVAQALRDVMPDAKPLFLCTKKEIDRVILEPSGFEFIPQTIVPPVKSVGGLLRFWRSWRETKDLVKQILRDRKPAAVLGLGGYAAGVAVKVAAQRGVPAAILNPDVVPGKANQFLVRYVKAICCQFEQSKGHLSSDAQSKVRVTGCPIRAEVSHKPPRDSAMKKLGLDPLLCTLVVTGASLGAQTVNEAVLTMLQSMSLQGWQVLHLSGRDHVERVRAAYRELNVPSRVIDFTPGMAEVWSAADLAISRSGASSCAELTVCGVPSILMPYPFHRDMHQRVNAQVLVDAGAAVLCTDSKDAKDNAKRLQAIIEPLLHDVNKRKSMADAAHKLGRPDASMAVAQVLKDLV